MNGTDEIWVSRLSDLGFNKVKFPIIIKDGQNLEVVNSIEDFAGDPDYYLFPNDNRMESLIDSTGTEWSWKYDYGNKTNLPDLVKWTRTAEEIKKLILTYFEKSKLNEEVANRIADVSDTEKLIDILGERS